MIPSMCIYMNENRGHIIELLSPAGNPDCLRAAVRAGADAIYLAGQRFGARASADNFTDSELIEALDYAHTYNRKIYLTLNTLIKEREWKDIYGFLKPLYINGLDGIIIQDIGLIKYLRECFPELPLHASTQMTVTHSSSCELLKEMGICRVVTARELNLDEIRDIKRQTGLEVEVFIHGAMCYSYSGACLFSSFLGGRSGNRGRCAGPCRLPYNGSEYPLSMRDLCLAEHMSELIDTGVDSFKIEGRLKSPEYVTGVTRIYRDIIDACMEGGNKGVRTEDLSELDSLYLRGGGSTGYLHTHNSADMITLDNPSYSGPSAEKEAELKEWDNKRDIRLPISGKACFHVKQKMSLTLQYDNDVIITVFGDEVEEATGRPASLTDTEDRLRKTGNTPYVFTELDIEMDDNCFLLVSALNELRRRATDKLTEERLGQYRRSVVSTGSVCGSKKADVKGDRKTAGSTISGKGRYPDILVMSIEQLDAVMSMPVRPERIYIPYDLIYSGKLTTEHLEGLHAGSDDAEEGKTDVFLSLARIYRSISDTYMSSLTELLNDDELIKRARIRGVLVRNLEELRMLSDLRDRSASDTANDRGVCPKLKIIADHSVYVWNRASLRTVLEHADEVTLPLELNLHELDDIASPEYADKLNLVIYGRAPLMVSADCVMKTYGRCTGDYNCFKEALTDRYGKREPVYMNCIHCYNEIFNALPTSYHKKLSEIMMMDVGRMRIDLTDEDADTARRLIIYYGEDKREEFPLDEYTAGHMEKGAI